MMDGDEDTTSSADDANSMLAGLEEMQAEQNTDAQNQTGDMDDEKTAADLEAVFDVPVRVSAVLGRTAIPISKLLELGPGSVVELNRQVGESIDIYVNSRLVARGEIVLVEEKLGITMTEIIKAS